MDKLKVYQVVAITMLLLNIGLLAFLFLGPHTRGGGPGRPRAFEKLQLDEGQQALFHASARQHQKKMREIKRAQQEVLQKYFQQLATPGVPEPSTIPADYIRLEQDKVKGTYQHLLEVKQLLRPEQATKFPEFMQEVLPRVLGNDKKPPPPPKERR
ncbi:MAG: hypothetical protein AAGA31_17455 [Bacteroidota bacterium]